MPRALRGYQHVDYTALLNQLNGTCEVGQKKPVQVVKAKEKKSASNVSPEKRRRDSLMADNRMRYAYSASDNVIHDRDCSKVSGIKDSDFRMSEEFLLEKKRCKECYRRAVIRAGVRPEEAKYIYAYVRTLTQLKAQTADLVELFIRQKAVLQRAEPNAVCVKVNDDNWKICRDGDELFLFHNNYIRLPDYSRIMGRDFHLHQEVKSFGKCIPLMCSYSWENHVKRFKREDLSARLQDIANYERVNRFSLFYSYFYIVDWKKELIPPKMSMHNACGLNAQPSTAHSDRVRVIERIYRELYPVIPFWKGHNRV